MIFKESVQFQMSSIIENKLFLKKFKMNSDKKLELDLYFFALSFAFQS